MPDLADVVAAVVTAFAKARHQGDEASAHIAEYYRTQPLLEGLPIPRMRLSQVTIDMPVLVEKQTNSFVEQVASAASVVEALSQKLAGSVPPTVRLAPETISVFEEALRGELKKGDAPTTPDEARQRATQAMEVALKALGARKDFAEIARGDAKLVDSLRAAAPECAVIKTPGPVLIDVSIETAKVKAQADPVSVMRIKLTLAEAALEWERGIAADGSSKRVLTTE